MEDDAGPLDNADSGIMRVIPTSSIRHFRTLGSLPWPWLLLVDCDRLAGPNGELQMVDLHRDEVIVAALPYARGEDREVLVGALGSASGSEGVPALYQLVREQGPGSSHIRSSAVQQLATRVGKEATPVYAEALRDRSAEVQTAALLVLVECGDDRAVPHVLAYFKRRLRRKNRLATWDPREVPGTIAFALRHGVLDQVAQILTDNLARLDDEEWTRLMTAWPQVASGRISGSQGLRRPDPAMVDDWLYEYGGRREDRPDDDAGACESAVIKALVRAQQRAQDQSTR